MASEKVCIIGSGNWGCAIARIVGANAAELSNIDTEVRMWVFEEEVEGRKLTEIINTDHCNVKYLPDAMLPENIVAVPEITDAVKDATVLVFVLPHQFLPGLLPDVKGAMKPGAKAISLIKGIDFDDNGVVLISDNIRNGLGIDVSTLMGANVANEVAQDEFTEATIGYTVPANGELLQSIFNRPMFRVNIVKDTVGVELCGALKNIVAIGAGFCDGLEYGGNTKAAIIRIGLLEMKKFCNTFYDGIADETFFESCGLADLITTCFGGRNRKCAEAYARLSNPTASDWDKIEADILNGQKLQGTLTAKEVHEVLERTGKVGDFPFFGQVYDIAYAGKPVSSIVEFEQVKCRL